MVKRISAFLLTMIMVLSILPTSVFAASVPSIDKEEVTVRVGNTIKVDFTYGSSSNKAEVVISNTGIEANIVGNILYITGVGEGLSYVTLSFNDGTKDSVKVNVVDKYSNVDDDNNLEIKKGSTKNISIDLEAYHASYATVTYDSDLVTVNKNKFSTSGTLKISGKDYGDSILKIKYNTGERETYNISVVSSYSEKDYEEDVYLEEDEVYSYYVDLEDYDADKATIHYNSSYVSLNRSTFYSSSYLNITARRDGNSVVRIEYDSGVTEYINVHCGDTQQDSVKSSVSVDSIEVEKGGSLYFYVYLGDRAENATLSLDSSYYATLSTSSVSTSTRVKITGKSLGDCELKVKFDDGTRVYIPVSVVESNYVVATAKVDKNVLLVGEPVNLELFMGTNNSSVSITVDDPDIFELDLSGYSKTRTYYTVYGDKKSTINVKITPKDVVDESYITVKYPEGKTYKIMLSVIDLVAVDGKDKVGNNFLLRKNITANKTILDNGYIAGYTDGTFGPLNNITRQEFGVMLARILEYNGDIEATDYIYDVTASWSKDSIAELVAMGVVNKNEPFRPTDYITRYEVAEMLYNCLELGNYSTSCLLTDINSMTTLGSIVGRCWNAGLIAGYSDNTFGGANNITRAEAVTLINRIFYSNMETNKVNRFSDVSPTYWAYSYILKASQQ